MSAREVQLDAQVVALDRYREARRAADGLVALLQNPVWLVRVDVSTAAGEPVVVALVARACRDVNVLVPSHVNGFAIVLKAVQGTDWSK